MRGIPLFNFPAFHAATKRLREQGHEVFSPAENDIAAHDGVDISAGNLTGDEEKAAREHGFDKRNALAEDTWWICQHAEAIALLPGWEDSMGAAAEAALARALGLLVILLPKDYAR